jgi:DNA-binding XRE family transcriptional regulator
MTPRLKSKPKPMAAKNRLREIRISEGLPAAELSRLAKISEKTIARVEKGTRTCAPTTKHRILKGLNSYDGRSKDYKYSDVFPNDGSVNR